MIHCLYLNTLDVYLVQVETNGNIYHMEVYALNFQKKAQKSSVFQERAI